MGTHESSAGPFAATCVVASNLSVGSGVSVSFSFWTHLTASAPFRARPRGLYPAGYPRPPTGGVGQLVAVSRCLSAAGIRFSVILFPPGNWALLAVGLPDQRSGPRRGYRVDRRLPLFHGQSLHRAPTPISRLRLTRHQRGFKPFTRPVFPPPAATRMKRAAASAFPRASHPADQEPDNARQGGDRPTTTDLELHAQHRIRVEPPIGSSLTTCDLASHIENRQRGRGRRGSEPATGPTRFKVPPRVDCAVSSIVSDTM